MVSELIKKCIKSFEDLLENQSDKTLIKFFLEDLRSLKIEDFGGIDEVASGKDFPKNVQKYLKEIKSGIDNSCTLDSSLFDISRYLNWYQLFDGEGIDPSLAEGLFAAQIVGKKGLVKSNNFYMGLFLLCPNVHYPLHQHNALEIYYASSGTLQLQHGRKKMPFLIKSGEYSITPSNQVHSLTTSNEPCLLCYMWVSGTGTLLGPNWWWEEQKDGSWKRICWERQEDSSWAITGSENLTNKIIDGSGDS